MIYPKYGVLASLLVLFYSCTPEPIALDVEDRFGSLPSSVIHPADNLPNTETILLGKNLFWDPILSGDLDVACVTCHHPQHAYAEQLELSIGVGGRGLSEQRIDGTLVKRNAMTILNTAFNSINTEGFYDPLDAVQFWDNRTRSLEEQAIQPILSAEEMRGTRIAEEDIIDTLIQRLQNIPAYVSQFEAAFGKNSISRANLGKAIAAFERTLVADQSPFDRYVNGDESALTAQEVRGMISFIEVGCANCHSGPMFSDYELHVLTVPENERLDAVDDGDGEFAFRTPTLRNVSLTAPYMHNGVFATLEDVMEFYDDASESSQNPHVRSEDRAEDLAALDIPDDRVSAIIAFLKSLTDPEFDKTIPQAVPSGLYPGGNIE